jgi:hypothetical protein
VRRIPTLPAHLVKAMMDTLIADFRDAFRRFRKPPVFSSHRSPNALEPELAAPARTV